MNVRDGMVIAGVMIRASNISKLTSIMNDRSTDGPNVWGHSKWACCACITWRAVEGDAHASPQAVDVTE